MCGSEVFWRRSSLELRLRFLLIIDRLDGYKPGHMLQSVWELRLQCLSPVLLPFIAIRSFLLKQTHAFPVTFLQRAHTSCDMLSPKLFSVGERKLYSFLEIYCDIHKTVSFIYIFLKKLNEKKSWSCLLRAFIIKYSLCSICILISMLLGF